VLSCAEPVWSRALVARASGNARTPAVDLGR